MAARLIALILLGAIQCCGSALAQETFQDCSDCPIMVKVPPGTFTMGTSPAEATTEKARAYAGQERPQHRVTIKNEFAIGKFPITRAEFAVFVRETGRNSRGCYSNSDYASTAKKSDLSWRNPGFEQSDKDPVVCITFEDAQRYVEWLRKKTRKLYRLPTEAEWEYAARAGTTTARPWGDDNNRVCEFANGFDLAPKDALHWHVSEEQFFHCRDGYVYTSPVGSFPPNAFGLFDMLGNVSELMQDCWHENYVGAPSDGSAWIQRNCIYYGLPIHALRGGSWESDPTTMHSSSRGPAIDDADNGRGFRVALTLTR